MPKKHLSNKWFFQHTRKVSWIGQYIIMKWLTGQWERLEKSGKEHMHTDPVLVLGSSLSRLSLLIVNTSYLNTLLSFKRAVVRISAQCSILHTYICDCYVLWHWSTEISPCAHATLRIYQASSLAVAHTETYPYTFSGLGPCHPNASHPCLYLQVMLCQFCIVVFYSFAHWRTFSPLNGPSPAVRSNLTALSLPAKRCSFLQPIIWDTPPRRYAMLPCGPFRYLK